MNRIASEVTVSGGVEGCDSSDRQDHFESVDPLRTMRRGDESEEPGACANVENSRSWTLLQCTSDGVGVHNVAVFVMQHPRVVARQLLTGLVGSGLAMVRQVRARHLSAKKE